MSISASNAYEKLLGDIFNPDAIKQLLTFPFNSKSFQKYFDFYSKTKQNEALRALRVYVIEDTLKTCSDGYYLLENGVKVNICEDFMEQFRKQARATEYFHFSAPSVLEYFYGGGKEINSAVSTSSETTYSCELNNHLLAKSDEEATHQTNHRSGSLVNSIDEEFSNILLTDSASPKDKPPKEERMKKANEQREALQILRQMEAKKLAEEDEEQRKDSSSATAQTKGKNRTYKSVWDPSSVAPAMSLPLLSNPTRPQVYGGDCLEAALHLKSKFGYKVAVLNMASPRRPGGGYMTGAAAQEENIFRRTNYAISLGNIEYYDNHRQWNYPLPDGAAIYNPEVFVFRASEAEGYSYLEKPEILSFIAIPAYPHPELVVIKKKGQEPRLTSKFAEKTAFKIRIMLSICAARGHDCVVLSAFGCGAFGNPPLHMAELFHSVIHSYGFDRVFRNITFAIFDDKNALKAHNPQGNVAPFEQIFQKRVILEHLGNTSALSSSSSVSSQ